MDITDQKTALLPSSSAPQVEEGEELAPPTQPGCFGAFRQLVFKLVTAPAFDYFVLLIIILSCIMMATQSPRDEANGIKPPIYDELEMAFTYIFTTEVVLKLVGLGAAQYFAQGWNVFDCVVVGSAWLRVMLPDAGNLSYIDEFIEVWQRFDCGHIIMEDKTEVEVHNLLPTRDLVALLKELSSPMGFKDAKVQPTPKEVMARVKDLDLPSALESQDCP